MSNGSAGDPMTQIIGCMNICSRSDNTVMNFLSRKWLSRNPKPRSNVDPYCEPHL